LDLLKIAENFFVHLFFYSMSSLAIDVFDSLTTLFEKFDELGVVESEMNVSHFVLLEDSFVFVFFFTFVATFVP